MFKLDSASIRGLIYYTCTVRKYTIGGSRVEDLDPVRSVGFVRDPTYTVFEYRIYYDEKYGMGGGIFFSLIPQARVTEKVGTF